MSKLVLSFVGSDLTDFCILSGVFDCELSREKYEMYLYSNGFFFALVRSSVQSISMIGK